MSLFDPRNFGHEQPPVDTEEFQDWMGAVQPLPAITPEEKREAGAADEQAQQSEEEGMSLSEQMARGTRSYRYDMEYAQGLVRSTARKGDPDEQPFADPIYWAGFQVTGW